MRLCNPVVGARSHYAIAGCDRHLIINFENLTAFVEQAKQAKSPTWTSSRSGWDEGRGDWNGTPTMEDATKLAVTGWREGRERILEAKMGLERLLTKRDRAQKSEDWGMAGYRPDVPRYIAGEPEHMIMPSDRFGPANPIVSMMANAAVNWTISAEKIMNFGAALTSAIDQTERTGRRVELDVAYGIKSYGFHGSNTNEITEDNKDGRSLQVIVRVKRANVPLELDRVVFCLAHPSMFRRFMFSVMEQMDSSGWHSDIHSGYGQTLHVHAPGDQIEVPAPGFWPDESVFASTEAAHDLIQEKLAVAVV